MATTTTSSSSLHAKRAKFQLDNIQQKALDMVLEGKNVFITGESGTGKSIVIQHCLEGLARIKKSSAYIFITAPTGVAAYNVNGMTFYHWAGIGTGTGTVDQLERKIRRVPVCLLQWQFCQVLFMDELSMFPGELLVKCEELARRIRKNNLFFGGIQIVGLGDFYQLAPINASYAFKTSFWKPCFGSNWIYLKNIYRQCDPMFIKGLREVRVGNLTDQFKYSLLNHPTIEPPAGIERTRLYTKKKKVEAYNAKKLNAIPGDPTVFDAVDWTAPGFTPPDDKPLQYWFNEQFPAEEKLFLKVGAQIMFVKNNHLTAPFYQNGTCGVIERFLYDDTTTDNKLEWKDGKIVAKRLDSIGDYETLVPDDEKKPIGVVVRTEEGTIIHTRPISFEYMQNERLEASRTALPLRLAWALSIHKSQGMTIKFLHVDASEAFSPGQIYVALSRATDPEGLIVEGLTKDSVFCDPDVTEFYKSLEEERERETRPDPLKDVVTEKGGIDFCEKEDEESSECSCSDCDKRSSSSSCCETSSEDEE